MTKPLITEISWEDFQKLNIVVREQERRYYREDTDECVSAEEALEPVTETDKYGIYRYRKGFYCKVGMVDISLNTLVKDYIDWIKSHPEEFPEKNPICVAIHKPEGAYISKYLTELHGPQTFLMRANVKHLYSKRNYFYTTDEYFEIPKNETEVVYLIHFE